VLDSGRSDKHGVLLLGIPQQIFHYELK